VALGEKQVASMHRLGYATVEEVATVLMINVVNVYRHAKMGHLRASKIGHATYISLDSLDKFLRDSDPPAPIEVIASARRLRVALRGKAA
jgi:excisionase family DNA binding protein